MMSLGSTKPWKEVVGKILPNNTGLSSLALLEYYQPVLDWLNKYNKDANSKIGWTATKKSKLKYVGNYIYCNNYFVLLQKLFEVFQ